MTAPFKLTDEQVKEIRELYAKRADYQIKGLAKRFGLSPGYVKQIVQGRKRKRVPA